MKLSLKIKKIISFLAIASVFSVPMLVGAQFDPYRQSADSGLSTASVYTIIVTVMKWLLLILTVVAVIGFIISGFMYILGGGDGKEKAKGWLTSSIIGIVVALVGYIVISLISSLLEGQVQN